MKKPSPLDGDRAAIAYDNHVEQNASKKRWDAYYRGCQDARNHKTFNIIDYTNEDEIKMYEIGFHKMNLYAYKKHRNYYKR